MAIKCIMTPEGIKEVEVLPDKRRDMLVGYVIRACLGEVDIDYEMADSWVQGRNTLIDHDSYHKWEDGRINPDTGEKWKLREVRQSVKLEPPLAIIRLRRNNNNSIKRACKELYEHGYITSYTVRANGYIHVIWFKDYMSIERDPGFSKITVESRDCDDTSNNVIKAEYLRDKITFACTEYEALRQKRERKALGKRLKSVYKK